MTTPLLPVPSRTPLLGLHQPACGDCHGELGTTLQARTCCKAMIYMHCASAKDDARCPRELETCCNQPIRMTVLAAQEPHGAPTGILWPAQVPKQNLDASPLMYLVIKSTPVVGSVDLVDLDHFPVHLVLWNESAFVSQCLLASPLLAQQTSLRNIGCSSAFRDLEGSVAQAADKRTELRELLC